MYEINSFCKAPNRAPLGENKVFALQDYFLSNLDFVTFSLENVSSEDEVSIVSASSNNDDGIILLSSTATSYEYDFTIEDLIESGANVWCLSAGNSLMSGADTYWLFPDGADLSCINGYLINTGSSSITGSYLGSTLTDSLSDTATSWISCTLYPWSFTNKVSNLINSNSDCIVTLYYRQGSDTYGYSIGSVSYNTVFSVVSEPVLGSDFSSSELAIFGILAFSVLVSLVGVILRR